jgi:hypothetical protein
VLNDGTRLKSVEVRVDNGPWQPATFERTSTTYSWKLFSFEWIGHASGAHTIVSRVTDTNGTTQPEEAEMQSEKRRWEDNGQFTRKFRIC